MRVYELAKQLGLESKEVLARAIELGIDVKTASSGLDDDAAALIRLSYEEEGRIAPAEPEPEEVVEEAAEPAEPAEPARRKIRVVEGITVAEFAELARRPVGLVVKALIERGQMAGATQPIPVGHLAAVADALGFEAVIEKAAEVEVEPEPLVRPKQVHEDDPADLEPRPPVVTVMGHVDHGKTKLLDTIRRSNIIEGEAGGITQHIGAYQVHRGDRKITFIDTPGHEAFTALRIRGAEVTDIVVLVVAADDGVMPQTVEAISHAKAAGVPIVAAINKIDLRTADPVSVRAQLTEHGIVVEELGGDVVSAEISALTGEGIDQLLEYIDLVAELEEFSANPKVPASGTVIEAQLDRGRGPVATVIVQRGTLRRGDSLVAGAVAGRIRAMFDENGQQVSEAAPSTPVLTMGWDEVPQAGDWFEVTEDDRTARAVAGERETEIRSRDLVVPTAAERLQSLLEELRTADEAELRIIVKADTHGSLEAIKEAVSKVAPSGGRVTVVHSAVGGVTENDVLLAEATTSVVFGFGVRPDAQARRAAEDAGIEIRTYRVIYELLDDIEDILVGRLAPEKVEQILGVAEVRATFRAPRFGTVAGCYVTEGEITRSSRIRLVRDGAVVYDGSVGSLRRFKDDVRSVGAGFECGIGLENFRDIKEGDVLEAYEVREVVRG
jgi:translation initiation factor IF-2